MTSQGRKRMEAWMRMTKIKAAAGTAKTEPDGMPIIRVSISTWATTRKTSKVTKR
jgi:hypothetical protein